MNLVYSVLTQFANKGIDVTLFFHSSPSWKPKKAILWTLFPLGRDTNPQHQLRLFLLPFFTHNLE